MIADVSPLQISVEDPGTPDVVRLLEAHLAFARATSPPEDVHALDLDRLRADEVTFFTARRRDDGELLGIGALKELDPTHGEIKSMHTAAAARGTGVARHLLRAVLAAALERGYRRVSLETGTMEAFAPARRLYEAAGFRRCEPFNGYWESPNSLCMTLEISP